MPVGTQQMMTLSIDAMRSGASWQDPPSNSVPPPSAAADLYTAAEAGQPYRRKKRAGVHVEMLMYVMKHFPGNTHKSWKRQLFGDLSHGVTNIDLFDFETSTMGYTVRQARNCPPHAMWSVSNIPIVACSAIMSMLMAAHTRQSARLSTKLDYSRISSNLEP